MVRCDPNHSDTFNSYTGTSCIVNEWKFFQAMNRADLLFLSGALSALIMVTAIILGVIQKI